MGYADFTRALLKNNENLRGRKFEPFGRQNARTVRTKANIFENEKSKLRMALAKRKRDRTELIVKGFILAISTVVVLGLYFYFIH